MRHRGFEAWLDPAAEDTLYHLDSLFEVEAGLAGRGVSFRSVNYPDRYLRHRGFQVFLHPSDGSTLFKEDATFEPIAGHADGTLTTFRSVNYPDRFLRHRGFRLRLDGGAGELFENDTTWMVEEDARKGIVGPVTQWGLVPIHMAVLPDGRVFSFGSPFPGGQHSADMQMGGDVVLWDPADDVGKVTKIKDLFSTDAFCSSTKYLDGRLCVVGGNAHPQANMQHTHGVKSTVFFNDRTSKIDPAETRMLAYARWYSSLVTLSDGRLLTVGGSEAYCHNAFADRAGVKNSQLSATPEIFVDKNWVALDGAYDWELFGREDNVWWYPRAYLAPDGKVFGVSGRSTWVLDPDAPEHTIQKVQDDNSLKSVEGRGKTTKTGQLENHFAGASATSVMFGPGKIVIIGGGQRSNEDTTLPADGGGAAGATNAVTIVEYAGGQLQSRAATPMKHRRNWGTAVALPTGDVAVVGGSRKWNSYTPGDWVEEIEIWTPPTDGGGGTWRSAAKIPTARLYHSAALLLPDARVLLGGGGLPPAWDLVNGQPAAADGRPDQKTPFRDVCLFTPPYLFNANGNPAARPAIEHAEGRVARGESFVAQIDLQHGAPLRHVSIVSLPCVTHSHNNDQRYATLAAEDQGGGRFKISIPDDPNLFPPGGYMIFAVDIAGVPSEALRVVGRLPVL